MFFIDPTKEDYERCNVAYNRNTPPEALDRLANDDYFWVRRFVTRNPNTPQYVKDYIKIKKFLNYYD